MLTAGPLDELALRMELAREVAERAGEITLKYFQGDFQRATKLDGTIVTTADREAEQAMRSAIGEAFPEDGILGEEFGEKAGTSRYRWILDPIDGTLSFAAGVPFYGVLIGVEDVASRRCRAGVIHLPALRETVYAQAGRGCVWARRGPEGEHLAAPARVSSVDSLEGALLLGTDFWKLGTPGQRAAFERLAGRVRRIRTWSDCYGYLLVATGRAEIMLDPEMHPWDCAPLQPVLEEAGGAFSDWSGAPTIYGGSAVGSNGRLHSEVLEVLSAGP